jgi:protein-tyrosine kinase
MERIKQAIEKGKAQQPEKIGHRAHIYRAVQHPMPDSSQVYAELGDISYTSTRVAKLNAEHLERNRIVAFNKNDPKSISFDVLRTHILQKMEENGWRTLAITSPTPESGKTVVAINLAMSIAQQTNRSALLVDFDLRRPKVGTYLGIPMDTSVNELLNETAALSDALVNPDIPRMLVLATKNPVTHPAEIFASRKIEEMIKDIRERYESRVVIFDLPPVLIADDVIVLMPHIDCVLLVVANGMSTKREIEDSLRIIPANKLLGTILNKSETEPIPYYYHHQS